MIEKVNITDANVVELIREKLPAATEANKGLMQANGFEQGKNILMKNTIVKSVPVYIHLLII